MKNSGSLESFLDSFNVIRDRGFLPYPDPLTSLPVPFRAWEETGREMPNLLATGQLRSRLEGLEVLDASQLETPAQLKRGMLLLSFMGNAYVFGQAPVADRIPRGVAVPWYQVSRFLDVPPTLSYASYALNNWRRIDPKGPIELGNLVLLQNFLGGINEEWFVLVHVDIEAKAGKAMVAVADAQNATSLNYTAKVHEALVAIAGSLEQMNSTLLRMPEGCDPYAYYHSVRPYIHGWKNNPALPNGVVYEGVEAFASAPRQFFGETGAQSSIIPSLDAALGIAHAEGPLLSPFLTEMRDYMPPDHRAFIHAIEKGPSIRGFVLQHWKEEPLLRDAYNKCVELLARFRATHFGYAMRYIQNQTQSGLHNPTNVGTGGSSYATELLEHAKRTATHLI